MKKMKLFAIVAIIVATGSAFASTSKLLYPGEYYSKYDNTTGSCINEHSSMPVCTGGKPVICTVGNYTYMQGPSCSGGPLFFHY